MKIFSPILKGTTTVAQGTTNLSGSFTGSLLGTAATASYADNFTVGGTLTAQTINVQIITSSIEFVTGSTRNGSTTANTHQFTGSVTVTGSVGIGTNSPSDIFHISKTSTSNWDAYLENTNNTAGNGIRLIFRTVDSGVTALNAGGIRTVFNSRGASTVDNDIIISTRGADNIIVAKNNGNVGIGTTSPSASLETRVAVESPATNKIALIAATSNGANDIFRWYDGATQLGVFKNNGNVGIGTTTPSTKLQVTGVPATNSDAVYSLILNDSTGYASRLGSGISFGGYYNGTDVSDTFANIKGFKENLTSGDYAGAMSFQTRINGGNPTERMRITSAGNVGIGTTSPSEKLHIYGGGLGPEVKLEGTFGSFYIRVYNDNFNIYTPQGRNAISIANNGNVYNYSNTTSWQTTSDIRVKENINTIENALNVITSLNPVSFNYKQEFAEKNNWDDIMKLNNIGFIAQEFENVFPKYVYTKEYTLGDTPIEDFKSIDTGHLVPYLVKAIQELSAKNTSLEERLTALENN